MELKNAMTERRSIRKFKEEKVKREDIEAMIDAAILAPSWKNSQVSRYHVVMSDEALLKVKSFLPEFNANNVADAPVLLVCTIIKDRSGFNRDASPANELGNGWGMYDNGLQHMNLTLKATELGLSTLILGLRDHIQIADYLKLGDEEMITSIIAVGYADIHPDMPKRKAVEDITKFY